MERSRLFLTAGILGALACPCHAATPMNLSKTSKATASSEMERYPASQAIDGKITDQSRWVSAKGDDGPQWLEIDLGAEARLGGIHLFTGYGQKDAIPDFIVQFKQGEAWKNIPSGRVTGNRNVALRLPFDDTIDITTRALRILVENPGSDVVRIKEIKIWPYSADGIPPLLDKHGNPAIPEEKIPRIYLNQSGFNLGKPKRFTAPLAPDGTPFSIREKGGTEELHKGSIRNHIGDFTAFDPQSTAEFVVVAGDQKSVPFRIGQWWLERVSYQGMVDFMVDSRHYHGTHTKPCIGSFGWRDDHHFAFELNTLVPQFLSNPSAYLRMPKQITYQPAGANAGKWGALEPYDESAPDIVKMIHWGADVIVTQKVDHMFLKEQLAYFLYAWPWLKQWLPEQNYAAVLTYARDVWAKPEIGIKYPYDWISENHNLFEVKTTIGGYKGENPPGHSVAPNLLMQAVALREQDPAAESYFKAAHDQVAWMIANLDWNEPGTHKGQRQSEHVTMTGLAMMAQKFPDRAPAGLKQKINAWAESMIGLSDNMWDFRRLSETEWVPTSTESPAHWNEPGNVMGFPASLLAALPFVEEKNTRNRLEQLVWAHFDNCFGRNPTGRHFSYDAPREIEGVEHGWYSYHIGGIGQLADARFVFDGAPKNRHYPYHPEVGDFGWTEGWVNFNTAFNLSMAYLARSETAIKASWQDGLLTVRLRAPLNFDYGQRESATIEIRLPDGKTLQTQLLEESANSPFFSADYAIETKPESVSYGMGYFETRNPVD